MQSKGPERGPGRSSTEFSPPSAGALIRSLLPNLAINGALPIVLYQVLRSRGVATVPALVAGSVFPLAFTLWSWVRTRHLDLIAGISLVFIVISAVASLVSGSARFALIKESVFTGVFGLVFFGSLLAARPLMFYMARQFSTGGDPERMRAWNDLWQYPDFRHPMRVMTAMWGAMFVADALMRVALVFILSTTAFLVASQVLFYATFALTMSVTVGYGRRSRRRSLAEQKRRGDAPPGS